MLTSLLSKKIKSVMNIELLLLALKPIIDAAAIAEATDKLHHALVRIPNLELLPATRDASAKYRGTTVYKQCTSWQHEVTWRTSLLWRGLASQRGSIPKLWWEDALRSIRRNSHRRRDRSSHHDRNDVDAIL